MTEKEIDKIAKRMVAILKEEKIVEEKTLKPFQATEQLLYDLELFRNTIEVKEKFIQELKIEGKLITKRTNDVNVQTSKVYLSEMEKVENKIEKLEQEKERLINVVEMVEKALEAIKNNKYYEVIELKYFENKTFEEIAEKLKISVITAKRNRNILIKRLQLVIFSDNVLKNILK